MDVNPYYNENKRENYADLLNWRRQQQQLIEELQLNIKFDLQVLYHRYL